MVYSDTGIITDMNSKQTEAITRVQSGENIFLTGPAGTGKSYTLHKIIEWAKESNIDIGITASTGQSAYLLKGRTIHSFLGIGLATKSISELISALKKWNFQQYEYLQSKLRILIIDEISMINDELLDFISEYLSKIRGCELPFGGCQVVLTGDFCQLPPVNGKYCFISATWKRANISTVLLEELIRQDGDTIFQTILQELRWGRCSDETLAILNSHKETEFHNGIIPTKLYSVNVDVDKINKREYDALVDAGAPTKLYKTRYSLHTHCKKWAESVKIPDAVELCIGAQVLVTWNIGRDSQIFNGTRGVISYLGEKAVVIRLENGKEAAIEFMKMGCEFIEDIKVMFMPLKLAYALSIHKSQGMTLDAVEIDLGSSIFEYGQAYTALSRARNLPSIKIIDVKAKSFKTHKIVKKFYGIDIK